MRASWIGQVAILVVVGACGATMGGATRGGGATEDMKTIGAAELAVPIEIQAPSVTWTRPVASLLGEAGARNTQCKTRTTEAPIASFRLTAAIDDLSLRVDQSGGYTEFILVGPEKVWQQCNGATLDAREVTWTAGEYRVYPTGGAEPFKVTVTSPRLAAASAPVPPGPPKLTVQHRGVFSIELAQEYRQRTVDVLVEPAGSLEVQLRIVSGGREQAMTYQQCDVADEARCDFITNTSGSPVTTLPAARRIRISGWQGAALPRLMTLQVIADRNAVPMDQFLVGTPTAETPLERRDLAQYGLDDRRWRPSWSNVAYAFGKLPAGFVLYATKEMAGTTGDATRTVAQGEPLFLFEGRFVRASGEMFTPRIEGPTRDLLPTLVSSTRPTAVVMPSPQPPETRSDVSMYHYPYGDDAADIAYIDDPRVTEFMRVREPVKTCIARELATRGSGFGYDIATYNRAGTLKKVESLTKHIEDKVYKVCKVGSLDAKRAKLQLALRAEALKSVKAALEAR